jgi:hypothetical protein
MVVIEFSKSARATCRTCNNLIEKDVMKLGTAVSSGERYLNMEWHHEACFWEKRAAQYYKRNGKKVNILLKPNQFSNQHILDAEGVEHIEQMILACNLKWGTPVALEKAGIEVPPQPEKASSKKRAATGEGGTKKRVKKSI